jgi:hypothetical protein
MHCSKTGAVVNSFSGDAKREASFLGYRLKSSDDLASPETQ